MKSAHCIDVQMGALSKLNTCITSTSIKKGTLSQTGNSLSYSLPNKDSRSSHRETRRVIPEGFKRQFEKFVMFSLKIRKLSVFCNLKSQDWSCA